MEWTTGQIVERIKIPNQTLQTWLRRFPDLIESSGGGKPGQHRRFPIQSVFQLAVVAIFREGGWTWSLSRMLRMARQIATHQDDVLIHDEFCVVVTKNDCLIGPSGHRKFMDDKGFPIPGTYFRFTDLHREFYGPHKPRDPETPNERRVRLGFDEVE